MLARRDTEGREMSEVKHVYAEEFLAVHNKELEAHSSYRPDMKYTLMFPRGNLVMDTRDKVLTPEDAQVFEEVGRRVAQRYKLIIP